MFTSLPLFLIICLIIAEPLRTHRLSHRHKLEIAKKIGATVLLHYKGRLLFPVPLPLPIPIPIFKSYQPVIHDPLFFKYQALTHHLGGVGHFGKFGGFG